MYSEPVLLLAQTVRLVTENNSLMVTQQMDMINRLTSHVMAMNERLFAPKVYAMVICIVFHCVVIQRAREPEVGSSVKVGFAF
jgi:hypothetical protein